ncbi:MAG TPA: hypothetical protein VF338_03550 [Leptolinea sp.]
MTKVNGNQFPTTRLEHSAGESVPSQPLLHTSKRIRNGLIVTLIGFGFLLLGARPSIFGLDRSSVIGFAQIAVFLFGIGIISIGAYISMRALWQGMQPSIAAEVGMRFISTGFVIALFAGMADVIGLGSHPLPKPFFGPWQSRGVQVGELVIGIGILLMFPFHRILQPKITDTKPPQSMDEDQNINKT